MKNEFSNIIERPGGELTRKGQQIVQTAESLFMRHGIKRVTVGEICLKAGVSKMTFYKYFKNKLDLIKRILISWFDDWHRKLDDVDGLECSFPEKARMMMEYKLDLAQKFSPDLIEDFYHLDPGLNFFLDELYKAAYERLCTWWTG
jgi:AcrR family transcriptional regulator